MSCLPLGFAVTFLMLWNSIVEPLLVSTNLLAKGNCSHFVHCSEAVLCVDGL